jgi:hypothetical protein
MLGLGLMIVAIGGFLGATINAIDSYLSGLQDRADNYENEEGTRQIMQDLEGCATATTYGEERVTNGSFDTNSDWIFFGSGFVIADGKLTKTDPSQGNISAQNLGVFEIGKTYEYSVTTSGNLSVSDKVVAFNRDFTSAGTFTGQYTAAGSTSMFLQFRGSSNVFSVEEVSVKEILTEGSGNSLLEDASLVITPTAYSEGILHSTKPPITYGEELIVNGDFSDGSGWIAVTSKFNILNGVASCNDPNGFDTIYQSTSMDIGKKYRVNADVNVVSGSLRIYVGISEFVNINASDSDFSVDLNNAGNNFFYLQSRNFIGTIDNVSVKEVLTADLTYTRAGTTTRTNAEGNVETVAENVPVINYENFSYQDVLGSELVTNGDFSDNSVWSNFSSGTLWSIENGKATHDSGQTDVNDNFREVMSPVLFQEGKTYSISVTVVDYVSGDLLISLGFGDAWELKPTEDKVYTQEITISNPISLGTFFVNSQNTSPRNPFVGSIENISVKEVTQEVVPNSGTAGIRISDGAVLSGGFEDLFDPQNGTLFIRCKNLADDGVRRQIILQEPVADDRIVFRYEPTSNQAETVIRDNGAGISTINHIPTTLGEELIVDGGFDNDFNDWSASSSGFFFENNEAKVVSANSGKQLYQGTVLESGKTYNISFEITSISQGAFAFMFGSGTVISQDFNSIGVHSVDFTYDIANGGRIGVRTRGATTGTIDNISVKEVSVKPTTEYINYAITWENGSHKFYVDGVLVGENTPTITGVQGISELVTDSFNGDGEILIVYKHVLTQSEITCLQGKYN